MKTKESIILSSILTFTLCFCTEKEKIQNNTLTIDGIELNTDGKTKDGTPIIDMWKVPMDTTEDGNFKGFKALQSVEARTIWQPENREDGAYNHYSALIIHNGIYYAMWGNNQNGEDAPGQRILFSTSNDWENWSEPQELFPAPGPILNRGQKGIHLKADRWIVSNGDLFGIAYVHGAGIYPIARKLLKDGSFGDPFTVDKTFEIKSYPKDFPIQVNNGEDEFEDERIAILNGYLNRPQISWWASQEIGINRVAIDDSPLIESFIYPIKDDYHVLMMRNWGTPSNPVHNNRIYVSFKHKNSKEWPKLYPTNIPDSPSRSEALVLKDGSVLLIGSQAVPSYDQALYLDRDPLTISYSSNGLTFNDAFIYRTGAPKKFRIPNVSGRNLGFAYCSSTVDNGFLYTMCSVGKEDIEIMRVDINEILENIKPQNTK